MEQRLKMNRYKIALLSVCLNKDYHQYLSPMIESARKFLLKGSEIDFLVWTDMPPEIDLGKNVTKYPTEPMGWPAPTLFRYNLFLEQEEKLKEYDYVFYCDADMLFVSRVGEEILGEGLTAAQHPMYALSQEYIPPYEPNSKSTAYIPRPGKILEKGGKKKFQPYYYAGGFQGGRPEAWVKAMKEMKKNIEKDFAAGIENREIQPGYISIWNDESHWNKYLFKNPPAVVLSPSYIYPDSLIKSYYQAKIWGRAYVPKLVTLTKKFSLSKEGGTALTQLLQK